MSRNLTIDPLWDLAVELVFESFCRYHHARGGRIGFLYRKLSETAACLLTFVQASLYRPGCCDRLNRESMIRKFVCEMDLQFQIAQGLGVLSARDLTVLADLASNLDAALIAG